MPAALCIANLVLIRGYDHSPLRTLVFGGTIHRRDPNVMVSVLLFR